SPYLPAYHFLPRNRRYQFLPLIPEHGSHDGENLSVALLQEVLKRELLPYHPVHRWHARKEGFLIVHQVFPRVVAVNVVEGAHNAVSEERRGAVGTAPIVELKKETFLIVFHRATLDSFEKNRKE